MLAMVRVVVLMQENKTPDFYFPTLAEWGANIQNRGNLLTTPPLPDPVSRQNIYTSTLPSNDAFSAMATAAKLPDLCFVWSPAGYDEHAPDQTPNQKYVSEGQNLTCGATIPAPDDALVSPQPPKLPQGL
jgi:hypothetical protein